MKIIDHKINLPTYKLLFVVFLLLFLLSLLVFIFYDFDPQKEFDDKLKSILSGLCVGLAVASLQFFITILEQKKIAFYERLGIEDILDNRDDKEFYKMLILNSKSKIYVMGSTCSRLCEDFAEIDVPGADALITALRAGVQVRLLVSASEYLEGGERAKLENITLEKANNLKEKFPESFAIKFLEGTPVHNVMVCDDVCIFGPIFRGLKSKNTPSLVARTDSIPAKAYIDNFEYEWDKGDLV